MKQKELDSLLKLLTGHGGAWRIPAPLSQWLEDELHSLVSEGWLRHSTGDGFDSFAGTDDPVSGKWNVAYYQPAKGKSSRALVTRDVWTLANVLRRNREAFRVRSRLVEIDDAGWGSPIGGTMVGVAMDGVLKTAVIEVGVYQRPVSTGCGRFEEHHQRYREAGLRLVEEVAGPPSDDLTLRICTGNANDALREALRGEGYHVVVGEIVGVAQDGLEKAFGKYLENLTGCRGLYRDPKTQTPANRAGTYRELVADKRMRPYLKTCWKSLTK